jgi:hypothetical protein
MAEFQQPPTWKPGDLVTSANLNIYSNNDLYFYEQLKNVGAGVFRKVKEVVLTESADVIDVTDIHLRANKIYYCFLVGGIAYTTENTIRIYFNGDYDISLYRTSYFYLRYNDFIIRTDPGGILSMGQFCPFLFIPFKIVIPEANGFWPHVIIEKHHTTDPFVPNSFEGLIMYDRHGEIFSMRIEVSAGYFLPNTKLTIWESAFI